MPLSYVALSARSSEGSFGPAKLILMTRAPCFTDQSMPLRMLKVVLSALAALVEKACTARRRAPGAMPSSRWCEAMAPAMPVPCACGFSGASIALKRCAITPSRSGCGGIDFRIDHRDRDIGAADDAVDVGNLELLQDVLRGVALWPGSPREAGAGSAALLLQGVDVVPAVSPRRAGRRRASGSPPPPVRPLVMRKRTDGRPGDREVFRGRAPSVRDRRRRLAPASTVSVVAMLHHHLVGEPGLATSAECR